MTWLFCRAAAAVKSHIIYLSCCRFWPDCRIHTARFVRRYLHCRIFMIISLNRWPLLVLSRWSLHTAGPARQILNRSAAMIAASGTVTLEAAISGVPGVVIYHLSPLNRLFTRLFYKKDTPVLPDLVLGRQHYPFLLPPRLSTDALYQHAADLLDNLPARRQKCNDSQQLCGLLRAGQALCR